MSLKSILAIFEHIVLGIALDPKERDSIHAHLDNIRADIKKAEENAHQVQPLAVAGDLVDAASEVKGAVEETVA